MNAKLSLENFAQKYLNDIDALIDILLDNKISSNNDYCAQMAKYHFSTGGKRIRALIPLIIVDSFQKDPRIAMPIGAAVEMIHNATLVHDDLQDGDEVRRGKPTVWKKYSSVQAINCGDAMFFYAFELANLVDVSIERKSQIQSFITQATLGVIEGQAQEFQMKVESFPRIARYLQIIQGKTSGLFSLPIMAALEIVGCDPVLKQAANQAAKNLGVIFQIQDDLIDIYGDKNRDQKATDIAEGKISFLVAHVNEHGSLEDQQVLSKILNLPRTKTQQTDIATAIAIFNKYDAPKAATNYITGVKAQIRECPTLAKHPKLHGVLIELCDLFSKPIAPSPNQ